MGFFLGIDGGGTRTSCLVGDEKSILGSGSAGASNVLRVGEAGARRALVDAVQQACGAANVDPSQVSRTCIGVAGAARPHVAEMIRKILSERVSGEIEVVGDMVIALHAAFADGPGLIVIAGTGSIAYGRDLNGETARAGGWGFAVSDEGSGHWIGRAAVASTLRAADENRNSGSTLLRGIMNAWNIETLDALVTAANASPAPDFAAVFPAVLAEAKSGDVLSADILIRAGSELSVLGKIIVGRLFADTKSVPVAMSGGVFGNSALVRETFYKELTRECPQVVILAGIVDPVRGALDLARK